MTISRDSSFAESSLSTLACINPASLTMQLEMRKKREILDFKGTFRVQSAELAIFYIFRSPSSLPVRINNGK